MKVFAIGFNKCGTTSLHTLFRSLGLRSYHGVEWRACDNLELLRSYDCFSDGIPKDLARLDNLFPASKFILQVRDLESWIYSRLAHIDRKKERADYKSSRTWDNTQNAIKSWIRKRNAYHLFVLSYFSERPSDLLIVNFIQDQSAATMVSNFLGYGGEREKPRENVNPRKKPPSKHIEMLKESIAALGIPESEMQYDIYCPSLVSLEDRAGFPVDSSMISNDFASRGASIG